MQAKAKYAVSGALAGAVNGLFGGGGGMVLVPLLSGWCGMEGKRSFAKYPRTDGEEPTPIS